MSGSNLRESLKNQFRGAYGSRMQEDRAQENQKLEHADTSVSDPNTAQSAPEAQVPPAAQPFATAQSFVTARPSATVQSSVLNQEPATNSDDVEKTSADMEMKKGQSPAGQLPCGITDFLNATPEEQLCYSLGEQMAAILKYLLRLPKPWVNLTYADIRNDAGEPVPAESRRTMVGILQKKGFIRERRRADIGIYKGITFVLDPELANTFCRLNGLEPPAWLYDARPNKKTTVKPGKKAGRAAVRNTETDRTYAELVAQNEKLRKEIEDLKALLVSKAHGQVQE